jgi:hypothetical protein
MDNTTIKQVQDIISKSKTIGVAAPKDPTLDEMAAALGLYLILKSANKEVQIASLTDPIVEVSSLVGIDKVGKTLAGKGGGNGDLTVSFPYTEGEIDKVSYTLEEGYLNIIVKASEKGLSFDEKNVEFSRGGGASGGPEVVFSIGVKRIDDLDPLFDTQNMDIRIINIDNKSDNEQYGDINLVSAKLSTLSEGVADLVLALNMHIDQDAAQNLLSGITDGTNNFQDPKTSSLAFEMASLLIKKGATREFSESARRGISVNQEGRNQSQARLSQPARQDVQRNQEKSSDKPNFEEHLTRRVAEEKAREAQTRQAAPSSQPASATRQLSETPLGKQDDLPTDDEAPNDWLAPKVYKGSSEV